MLFKPLKSLCKKCSSNPSNLYQLIFKQLLHNIKFTWDYLNFVFLFNILLILLLEVIIGWKIQKIIFSCKLFWFWKMVQLFLNLRTRVLILNIHIAMKCDVRGGKKWEGGIYFNLKGGDIYFKLVQPRNCFDQSPTKR